VTGLPTSAGPIWITSGHLRDDHWRVGGDEATPGRARGAKRRARGRVGAGDVPGSGPPDSVAAIGALGTQLRAPTPAIARDAARLRALNISPADGFALATARAHNASLASFDRRVSRATSSAGLELARISLIRTHQLAIAQPYRPMRPGRHRERAVPHGSPVFRARPTVLRPSETARAASPTGRRSCSRRRSSAHRR
jgi:hypothetical protein